MQEPIKLDKLEKSREKDKFAPIIKAWIDKFAHSLGSSDTKNYIQQLVIEPFLEYIFHRAFPYVIIAICIFLSIFIIVILIFILLLVNQNKTKMCPFCERLA